MGYFSNLSIDSRRCREDLSYPSPEQQLLWRLEDLEERLEEMRSGHCAMRDEGACLPKSDLRYVLPGHLMSEIAVREAIELAVEDLAERYGIYAREETEEEKASMDELTGMQIMIPDILSIQACCEWLSMERADQKISA